MIGQLWQLKELYLFANDLSGSIPTEIGLLEQVEIVSLGENKLTGECFRNLFIQSVTGALLISLCYLVDHR